MTDNASALNPGEFLPDIRELAMTLWRHRILIIGVGAAVTLLGLVIVATKPTAYRATTTIIIQDSVKLSNDFTDVTKGPDFTNMTVQTEVKLLTSPAVALKTIKATGLDKIPEFAAADERAVLSHFAKNLSVSPQGSSRAIEISFRAKDPELAARVANAHVISYMDAQIDSKKERVNELKTWFETKVEDLKLDVAAKSKAVSEFRARENLAVGKDSQELIYQQITDTSTQLVPLQVRRYDLESRLKAVETAQASGSEDAILDAVKSPVIQDLKVQESLMAHQVSGLAAKYGPKHPALRSAQSSLAQAKKQISDEVATIIGSMQNELEATIAQEELLTAQLESLKLTADDLRLKLVNLKSLMVEQETSQKLLDSFLTNYENIQSQLNFARPDATVASPAIAPVHPSGPSKKLLMMVVLVLAGGVALGVAFVVEMIKSGLRNFDDIRKLGQTPLGIIPKIDNPVQVMLSPLNSSLKEAVKRIYLSALMNKSAKTIMITSALPLEGRTTLSALLAYYLNSVGQKVLLIDADFLKPDLGRMLTTPQAGYGFADVLAGRTPIAQAIRKDANGLHFIASGLRADLNPDLLNTGHLDNVLSQLKNLYNFIIIDSGPVLARNEANTIASHTDGVIAIAEWDKTSEKNVSNMLSLLSSLNAPMIGMVMNRVDLQKYKESAQGTDFLLPRVEHAA